MPTIAELVRARAGDDNPAILFEDRSWSYAEYVTACAERAALLDELLLMYPSANRDEAVFDAPERFDVGREPNPHVAFGFGTHFCLGAALARLEIRVMFEELLPRLHDLRLASGIAPERIPNAFVRGFRSLHVEFEASQ